MDHEKARAVLDSLSTDPQAQELLAKISEPDSLEARIRVYVNIAEELGYDLTEQELSDYLSVRENEVRASTEAAAEEIRKLRYDELAGVAGGGSHSECKDTYKDKENCWFNDACDIAIHHYKGYQCHRNWSCRNYASSPCGEEQFRECGCDWV